MTPSRPAVSVCVLSPDRPTAARAIASAHGHGLPVYLGLTHEAVVAAARESIAAAASGDAVPAGPVAATGGLPHPTGDR